MEGVVEAKLTASPELDVAFNAKGDTPRLTLLRGRNVMICHAADTVKLCVTDGAAGGVPFPG
jgi:hypothetical protein